VEEERREEVAKRLRRGCEEVAKKRERECVCV
jgi:hypothetical protein